MPARTLKRFLDTRGIQYVSIQHSPAYTSPEVAASAHVPGDAMAKSVIVRLDGDLTMAVLSSTCKVDMDLLKEASGATTVELVTEKVFGDRFPDCPAGAMPPFGNLYDMPVYVAERLTRNEEIAFNAGSFTEVIRMRYTDFERLVEPRVLAFSVKV